MKQKTKKLVLGIATMEVALSPLWFTDLVIMIILHIIPVFGLGLWCIITCNETE